MTSLSRPQLLRGGTPEMLSKLHLQKEPEVYAYTKEGANVVTVSYPILAFVKDIKRRLLLLCSFAHAVSFFGSVSFHSHFAVNAYVPLFLLFYVQLFSKNSRNFENVFFPLLFSHSHDILSSLNFFLF